MTDITDPAERLGNVALDRRYATLAPTVTPLLIPDFDDRYAHVCDLVVQLLWPELYETSPEDTRLHTSYPAREIARLFFAAAALEPDESDESNG